MKTLVLTGLFATVVFFTLIMALMSLPFSLIVSLAIAVFIMFFIGAQKVQKNRFLWGVLGALSFLIPVLVLGPIAWNMVKQSAGGTDDGPALLFSYGVIVIAVGVFAAILAYKKVLIKVPETVNDKFVFCSECGMQCPANTAFCNKCGYKIGGA